MILCVLLKEKHGKHGSFDRKIWGIFPMERNSAQGPRNKIWWKAISLSKLCNFLRKMVHVVIYMYFSLFLKGLEIFFLTGSYHCQTIDQKGVCLYFWFVLFCFVLLFLFFVLFCFVCLFVFQRLIFPNCFYFSENIFFFETSINLRVREKTFQNKTINF